MIAINHTSDFELEYETKMFKEYDANKTILLLYKKDTKRSTETTTEVTRFISSGCNLLENMR